MIVQFLDDYILYIYGYDIKKCSGIVINWNLHISPRNSEGCVAILFSQIARIYHRRNCTEVV